MTDIGWVGEQGLRKDSRMGGLGHVTDGCIGGLLRELKGYFGVC